MERGKSLGEFVLQGRPRAIIRITLQGRAAEHGDVTVELTIKAIKGPSAHSWVVNGKSRSDDDVRALLLLSLLSLTARFDLTLTLAADQAPDVLLPHTDGQSRDVSPSGTYLRRLGIAWGCLCQPHSPLPLVLVPP